MEFEFDPRKDEINRERHGISLLEAQELWAVPNVIAAIPEIEGELRWSIIGELREKLYVAIFTKRESRIRLISCHRADGRWKKEYAFKILN
jgi:uncharacterized DUF497 family protein